MKLQIVNDSVVKLGEISFTRNEYVPIFKNVKYNADGDLGSITADSALEIKRKFDGATVFSVSLEETTFYDINNVAYTDYEVLLSDLVYAFSNLANVQGQQGPVGPQGVPGPVGPAGLNWQGSWVSGTSYVEDDAVGYDGASWFCILATNGTTAPDVDTTHWALLASQGATGPQGPQGEQGPQGPAGIPGASSVSTKGVVGGTASAPYNVLEYDINTVTGNPNDTVLLPQNAPIGKVVMVSSNGLSPVKIKAYNQGTTISINNSNSVTSTYQLYAYDTVKLISLGSDYWMAEIVAGTNITYNGKQIGANFGYIIVDSISNATLTPLSSNDLNTSYPNSLYPVGTKVMCFNITGGGLMYIKRGTSTWVSTPITVVS